MVISIKCVNLVSWFITSATGHSVFKFWYESHSCSSSKYDFMYNERAVGHIKVNLAVASSCFLRSSEEEEEKN